MGTAFIALRALTFATCFLLLWLWVAMRLRSLDLYLGAALPEWTAALGIVFILIGGSLALLCVTLFIAQGRGTPAPFDAPRQFVALGLLGLEARGHHDWPIKPNTRLGERNTHLIQAHRFYVGISSSGCRTVFDWH
jgi:hypothetical protein